MAAPLLLGAGELGRRLLGLRARLPGWAPGGRGVVLLLGAAEVLGGAGVEALRGVTGAGRGRPRGGTRVGRCRPGRAGARVLGAGVGGGVPLGRLRRLRRVLRCGRRLRLRLGRGAGLGWGAGLGPGTRTGLRPLLLRGLLPPLARCGRRDLAGLLPARLYPLAALRVPDGLGLRRVRLALLWMGSLRCTVLGGVVLGRLAGPLAARLLAPLRLPGLAPLRLRGLLAPSGGGLRLGCRLLRRRLLVGRELVGRGGGLGLRLGGRLARRGRRVLLLQRRGLHVQDVRGLGRGRAVGGLLLRTGVDVGRAGSLVGGRWLRR
ncbi:hypothetical protein [Pseudonocardia sp.]|uniref:hypothetical protein n=1 Tax=Pseudonocardia sp. TaxID=60912 RepID=UPI003D111C9E